ncbi:hypothetical protein J3B02_000479 [Coemansia erecta]|nr:hypothetical protein J3B02_000479 [Coemansia erecta]KAJ2871764.1 hypothetical protein FB639_004431 [Coemansia asiatica]
MKSVVVSALSAAFLLAGQTAAYDIIHTSSLNCRAKPTRNSNLVKQYQIGEEIDILCQIKGQVVFGNSIWDKTPDDCYVSDYYLLTGVSGIFKTQCVNSTATLGTNLSSSSESQEDSGLADVEETEVSQSAEASADIDTPEEQISGELEPELETNKSQNDAVDSATDESESSGVDSVYSFGSYSAVTVAAAAAVACAMSFI